MDTTLALPDEENKENVVGRESRRILKTAVSPKDIWWANMLLLGFCPIENEKVYAVSFHPDMFEQASTKGMQVVLYYLLRQINRDKTKKAFKGCWPTLDVKNNLNDYKKAANNLITELEHDGEIPAGTFRLSHLQSVGTRFYTLLWHLSVAAIRGALVKKYPSAAPPQKRLIDAGTYKLAGVIAKAPKHLIERQRQRFLSHAQAVVAVQGEWRTCARDLENEYRSLTQQMNKLKEERKRLAGFEKKSEDYINKRQKKIEQIKRVWGLFSKYHEENTANRDMLDNIASGKSSKLALNQADMYSDLASLRQQLLSSSMCSPVSPATAQAASTAVQMLSYQECQLLLSVNPLRDDQLDLLTLIKLWNLSLSIVKKRIESNHLLERSHAGSQLTEDAPMLTNLLDAHQNRLSALSAFNNSLNEELPALQEQTTELRKLFPPEPSITVPATPSRRPLGLQTPSRGSADASTGFELLPPTPDLALEKCLDEAQDETADMPAQVGATPLPKREDQERMVDSIHRAAKQRRPRLSIGSGRAAGGSTVAMKKAMFSRSKLTDEDKASPNGGGVLSSPLNTSGSSSDGEQQRWGRMADGHVGGLELSPMREMTAQFTLNLGLFSPFGGPGKGASASTISYLNRPGGILPPFASRAPAPLRSPSPASSPAESPFASDPLSFMDSFAPARSGTVGTGPERQPFKPAFKMEDDEDAWLMKEDSFLQATSTPLPAGLESCAAFAAAYSHKDALAHLGDEDVLAQLDDLEHDDEPLEDDLGAAVERQDALISLMADRLTSNILREDKGWQEDALNDLSMALDDLEDGDLGRTQQFSTNITALRHAADGDVDHDGAEEEVDEIGEADFDELQEAELEYGDAEAEVEAEPEEAFAPDDYSVEIRGSVRDEAKKKRISLGFDLRELESDEEGEDEEELNATMAVTEHVGLSDDGDDEDAENKKETEVEQVGETTLANEDEGSDEEEKEEGGGNVDWSMAIESEEEGDEEEDGSIDGDEEEDEDVVEINMEAEIAKAGGLGDSADEAEEDESHCADETALGDYSVLDITFKPPNGDGKDDDHVPASRHSSNDDLFADLQEELGEQEDDEDDEEADTTIQRPDCEEEYLEDTFEGEVKSIDELIGDLSSAEASSSSSSINATMTTTTTTVVDDIFFGLDDEEREAKEWDTFCASPAIGFGGGRRKEAPQMGLSLLSAGEMDETVMDGLLTPAGVRGDDHCLARRLTSAVTPSLHPNGSGSVTSPTRPRKKLSFSSLQ